MYRVLLQIITIASPAGNDSARSSKNSVGSARSKGSGGSGDPLQRSASEVLNFKHPYGWAMSNPVVDEL